MSHYKALLCEIRYVIDTKHDFYQIKPGGDTNGLWESRSYSDADYAGDKDTQKSVTGYIVLINRAVIAWC